MSGSPPGDDRSHETTPCAREVQDRQTHATNRLAVVFFQPPVEGHFIQGERRVRLDDGGNDCITCGAVGGRRSMVDPQIVILVVAGSSPVGHPTSPSRPQ